MFLRVGLYQFATANVRYFIFVYSCNQILRIIRKKLNLRIVIMGMVQSVKKP